MSFGNALSGFVEGFSAGASIKHRKEERKRAKENDKFDNAYKDAQTRKLEKDLKWYDRLADLDIRDKESNIRTREKALEFADEEHRSTTDYRDSLTDQNRVNTLFKLQNPDGSSPTSDDIEVPGAAEDVDRDRFAIPDPAAEKTSLRTGRGPATYETAEALYQTANDLGVSPYDLASVIDYETIGRWNPDIRGGKNNDYVGLIQFGPEERAAYGYQPGMSIAEQIRGPVKSYLADRGVRPGHGVDEIYGIINAGSLKNGRPRYGASDGNGTVAEHIERIKRRNRPRVEQLFGSYIVPTQGAASGGMIRPVQALAIGGIVEEEEEARTAIPEVAPVRAPAPQYASALPEAGPIPPERPAASFDDSADMADPKKAGFNKAYTAVKDGITYALQQHGLAEGAAVQDPDRAKRMSAYLQGKGAAEPSLMKKVYDAVDPDGDLSESERTMAALAHVHEFYASRGEPEKAQQAAASIIQYQRILFQRYAAIAQAAVSEGDIDGGVKAAIRAYASVPDGRDIKVKKQGDRYAVEFIDEETGKTVSNPVLSPREIAAFAMQVSPANFDQFIMDAAGQKAAETDAPSSQLEAALSAVESGRRVKEEDLKGMGLEERRYLDAKIKEREDARAAKRGGTSGGNGEGGEKPLSPEQISGVRDRVDQTWEMLNERAQEEGVTFLAETPPAEADTIKGAATDITAFGANRGAANITPDDALTVALEISTFDQTLDQKERRFSAIKEGDAYRVTLLNGKEALVPASRYNELDNIWRQYAKQYFDAAQLKQAETLRKAEKATENKATFRERQDRAIEEWGPGGAMSGDTIPNPHMPTQPSARREQLPVVNPDTSSALDFLRGLWE